MIKRDKFFKLEWRMSFRDIISHEREIELLKSGLRSGKLSHAYIFSGVEGIGKRLTALTLAKAVNCENPSEYDSCDRCDSCMKIEKGIHPDVRIIEAEGRYIRGELIRGIKKDVYLKPFEGRKKFYIIDSAEKMNVFAANSLLKILEEPPRDTVLILVTSKIDSLLPTILSRCQKVYFNPVRKEELEKFLTERGNIKEESSALASEIALGSINRALFFDPELIEEYRKFIHLMNRGRIDRMKGVFEFINQLAPKGRERIGRLLYLLRLWIRDIIIFKELGKREHIINKPLIGEIKNFSEGIEIEDLFKIKDLIDDTEIDIMERNANMELALTRMVIEFISLRKGQKDEGA